MCLWLGLVEAGVLEASWAAPRWACACCATQWGWSPQFDEAAAELAAEIGPPLGARPPAEARRLAAASGTPPSPRLDGGLLTAAPLGVPSLHLIGRDDPAKPLSVACTEMFAAQPTDATRRLYRPAMSASEAFSSLGLEPSRAALPPLRLVIEHPNDHMPPRQKEFAQALAEFAETHSPRERPGTLLMG